MVIEMEELMEQAKKYPYSCISVIPNEVILNEIKHRKAKNIWLNGVEENGTK